jgi:hypothetical protein
MSDQKRRLHFRGGKRHPMAVRLLTINYHLEKQGLEPLPTIADLEAAQQEG